MYLTRHICEYIPIFIHSYDYATASGKGYAWFGINVKGQWLKPAFESKKRIQANNDESKRIIKGLIDEYYMLLCNVVNFINEQRNAIQNRQADLQLLNPVYLVDFRNIIGDREWEDELHPGPDAAKN